MPRGPAPAWRQCAPHSIEARPYIDAAFARGYEQELIWAGIESRERAVNCRRGLFNCARTHKPVVAVSADVESAGGGLWQVRFVLHDKKVARAYVTAKYGENRAGWPYDLRAKGR
jgi:hypothetical protein